MSKKVKDRNAIISIRRHKGASTRVAEHYIELSLRRCLIMKWINCIATGLLLTVIGCSTQLETRQYESDAGVVDVMTFNIRNGRANDGVNDWTHRQKLVVDVISGYGADIVGLQEAFDFQVDYMAQEMPQYGVYYVGRDDGVKAGESCAIFYRRARYELADSGTFWFSDTPSQPSTHWGNSHLRICSWARLVNKSDGQGLYVYNLHLDHRSQNSREKSAQLLARQEASGLTEAERLYPGRKRERFRLLSSGGWRRRGVRWLRTSRRGRGVRRLAGTTDMRNREVLSR